MQSIRTKSESHCVKPHESRASAQYVCCGCKIW